MEAKAAVVAELPPSVEAAMERARQHMEGRFRPRSCRAATAIPAPRVRWARESRQWHGDLEIGPIEIGGDPESHFAAAEAIPSWPMLRPEGKDRTGVTQLLLHGWVPRARRRPVVD